MGGSELLPQGRSLASQQVGCTCPPARCCARRRIAVRPSRHRHQIITLSALGYLDHAMIPWHGYEKFSSFRKRIIGGLRRLASASDRALQQQQLPRASAALYTSAEREAKGTHALQRHATHETRQCGALDAEGAGGRKESRRARAERGAAQLRAGQGAAGHSKRS